MTNIIDFLEGLPKNIILGPEFEFQGAHSLVRTAFINGQQYIAKIINEEYSYVSTELAISMTASNLGIGPKIHAMTYDGYYGIMIMDQYEETLEDYLFNNQEDSNLDLILEYLRTNLELLHRNGICHGDFTTDNIFYSHPRLITIGDYGSSRYLTSTITMCYDWEQFKYIENTINDLKLGKRFADRWMFAKAINPKARDWST